MSPFVIVSVSIVRRSMELIIISHIFPDYELNLRQKVDIPTKTNFQILSKQQNLRALIVILPRDHKEEENSFKVQNISRSQ